MSLVNDMLRDLDARGNDTQGNNARDNKTAQSGLGTLRSPGSSVHRSRKFTALGAAALLIASATGSYWYFAEHENSVGAPQVVVESTPVEEQKPESAPARQAESQTVAVEPMPVVANGPSAAAVRPEEKKLPGVADEDLQLRYAVGQILTAAEQALAEDRLTHPPVNNAYAFFRHALLLEPNNQQALAGLERVRQRYELLANTAIAGGQLKDAAVYLQRLQTVGISAERFAALESAFASANQATVAEQPAAKAPQTASASFTPALAVNGAQPVTESGQPQASIARSWRTRESDVMAEATRYAEQGSASRGIELLKAFVGEHTKAEGAALTLFDLYLQEGDMDSALAMLPKASSAALRQYFQAKILVQNGDTETAGKVLDQAEPGKRIRQPYLALQGALSQRNGDHERAVRIYRQLVDTDNRQANYWLGLGVAAEAAQQRAQALQAFVAADQLAPASPAVASYVKERIRALSQ